MLKLDDIKKPALLVEQKGSIQLLTGELRRYRSLADLDRLQQTHSGDIAFVAPFCAARDNGMKAVGDEDLLVLLSEDKREIQAEELEALTLGQDLKFESNFLPDQDDDHFAKEVQKIQDEEIAGGNACQVIYSRRFKAKLDDMSPMAPLVLFQRLLQQKGQYLTFLFSDGEGHYFVGASPERQLEIHDEIVIKNPISGTLPKGNRENFKAELDAFLQDQKEINELSQILDEELKIMAQICPRGGKITGPFLRETGSVIHTEYRLEGHSKKSAVHALTLSLHAPTLVGSPLESAFRIIAKRETSSRRYYGGEIGVIRPNGDMYSAIMIRTAEIFANGEIAIQAGAGIVKDSDPYKEARETEAKAAGLIAALRGDSASVETFLTPELRDEINHSLKQRNQTFSSFHFEDQIDHLIKHDAFDRKITIINNEDNFAHILSHLTHHMGYDTRVVDTFDYSQAEDDSDIVVIGPGPGDINDLGNDRMVRLNKITNELLTARRPILGVCLGLQAIAKDLGMPVEKQRVPSQGVQKEIDLFGAIEKVGMYNSFSPMADNVPEGVEVSVDSDQRIMALKREHLFGMQFHAESAMTQNGYRIISEILSQLPVKKEALV
jgi:phenazine biosynthesis protein phzE